MRLYSAEGHGDQLLPNLVKNAWLILGIYIGCILVGTLVYSLFGMPVFDRLNHAILSVSTGGFSTVPDSIWQYESAGIEWVTIVLMLLGNTNLAIHLLLVRRKLKVVFKDLENRLFLLLAILFIPLMSWRISSLYQSSSSEALRFGLFQFPSVISTTGFQTFDTFKTQSHFFNTSVIILWLFVVVLAPQQEHSNNTD